jgi:endoglucanase
MLVAFIGYMNFSTVAASLTSPNWNQAANTWTTTGIWHNCDGSVDNDSAHHSLDMTDTDAAHHLGMVCRGDKEAWSPETPTPTANSQKDTKKNMVTAQILNPEVVQSPSLDPQTIIQQTRPAEVTNRIDNVISRSTSDPNNPFSGAKLYVNRNNEPANYVKYNHGYNAQLMGKIAQGSEVEWLGNWNWNIRSDVSKMTNDIQAQGALPVFVVYNIPGRDCGGYSSGGVNDAGSYASWINQIANTIGSRKAVVILEPDAITLTDCLSSDHKSERFQMLKNAVNTFNAQGNISVYIDAGHPNWLTPTEIASRLRAAGIDNAAGFALNIANFYNNEQNANYGKQISDNLGGKHFVVDTGRNGSGTTPDEQWCNPNGRSLGTLPTTNTGNSLIDAYLWIKGPGGSDGNCNNGPSAGQFWPDYALGLAQRTNW